MARNLWDILSNTRDEFKPRSPGERNFDDLHTRVDQKLMVPAQDDKLFNATNIPQYDRHADRMGHMPGDEEMEKTRWRLRDRFATHTSDDGETDTNESLDEAKRGPLSLKANIRRQYNRNENENYHSRNISLLAKHFGTADEHAKATEIEKARVKVGWLPDKTDNVPNVRDFQNDIHTRYIPKLFSRTDESLNEGKRIDNLEQRTGKYSADDKKRFKQERKWASDKKQKRFIDRNNDRQPEPKPIAKEIHFGENRYVRGPNYAERLQTHSRKEVIDRAEKRKNNRQWKKGAPYKSGSGWSEHDLHDYAAEETTGNLHNRLSELSPTTYRNYIDAANQNNLHLGTQMMHRRWNKKDISGLERKSKGRRHGIEMARNALRHLPEGLDERVLGTDEYEYWRLNKHHHDLNFRGKTHRLHKGEVFGIREAHSAKGMYRVIIPHMGPNFVHSVDGSVAKNLARHSKPAETRVNELSTDTWVALLSAGAGGGGPLLGGDKNVDADYKKGRKTLKNILKRGARGAERIIGAGEAHIKKPFTKDSWLGMKKTNEAKKFDPNHPTKADMREIDPHYGGRTKKLAARAKKKVDEAKENIDELSAKFVGNYINKASRSAADNSYAAKDEKQDLKTRGKSAVKAAHRLLGIRAAVRNMEYKLATKNEAYRTKGTAYEYPAQTKKGKWKRPKDWVGNKEGWDDETGTQMTPHEMTPVRDENRPFKSRLSRKAGHSFLDPHDPRAKNK